MRKLSIDDVLEEERLRKLRAADGREPLPEDYDPETMPASDPKTYKFPHDYPSFDDDLDPQELFESEGDEY